MHGTFTRIGFTSGLLIKGLAGGGGGGTTKLKIPYLKFVVTNP